MQLRTYLTELTPDARARLAEACGTTVGHLLNCGYGQRQPNPALCVAIEKHTHAAITRQDMRDDWKEIWPELVLEKQRRRA